VVALEYLFLSTVVGLGMAVGFSAVSDAINAEYVELGQAILTLDQGYGINESHSSGMFGNAGTKAGTSVHDTPGVLHYQHSTPHNGTNSQVVFATP
jgi:hypothetical protein